MHKTTISIKAERVINNLNGTFSIELNVEPLTTEQENLVSELLPNLHGEFHKLLNKEALLQSLATEAEIVAQPAIQFDNI